eukprot:3576507-Amphidinium_carterae.2
MLVRNGRKWPKTASIDFLFRACKNLKRIDPAIRHHQDVLGSWWEACHDGIITIDDLRDGLIGAARRVRVARQPCQNVSGPCGAAILTLAFY